MLTNLYGRLCMTGPATSLATPAGSHAPVREFRSILFGDRDAGRGVDEQAAPGCFVDLNLDQVIAAVTGAKEAYAVVRVRPVEGR